MSSVNSQLDDYYCWDSVADGVWTCLLVNPPNKEQRIIAKYEDGVWTKLSDDHRPAFDPDKGSGIVAFCLRPFYIPQWAKDLFPNRL